VVANQIDEFYHAELDNLCFNLNDGMISSLIGDRKGFFVPSDSDSRAIASLIYINNLSSLKYVCQKIPQYLRNSKNDMQLLGDLLKERADFYPLPTIDTESGHGVIFDAASIGQYLYGIDPRNTRYPVFNLFKNEKNIKDYASLEFFIDLTTNQCNVRDGNILVSLKNIHVHSKCFSKIIKNNDKIINKVNRHKRSFISHIFLAGDL